MKDLPDIPTTQTKTRYVKSLAVKELEALAMDEARRLHPTNPHLAPRTFRDDTANALTKSIIAFLRLKGFQAERINSTGRYLDNSKIVSDILGNKRRIGSGRWIPGSGQKGTADISATIWGQSVKIEVKMKDRQSPAQRAYQLAVEQAGGHYWICRNMDEFMNHYHQIIKNAK